MDLEMTPWGHREQAQEEAAVFQRLSCVVWDRWAAWMASSRATAVGIEAGSGFDLIFGLEAISIPTCVEGSTSSHGPANSLSLAC